MIKSIFLTLYCDIKNFFESYFLKASGVIIKNFFIQSELLKKFFSQIPQLVFARWICLFALFVIYAAVWILWIFAPIIISLLLIYGRLF